MQATLSTTSNFCLLDIKHNRHKIAKKIASGHRIPFTIHGFIQEGPGGIGNDDGTSIEFASTVTSIELCEPEFIPGDGLGRPWALLKNLKAGDKLQCDAFFTCEKPGAKKTVKADADGSLYIPCKEGSHYLAGQVGKHGELIGLYHV